MDKKIKVLFICDDIRLNTGVGIQARKLLTGLNKLEKYEVVNAGCALNHRDLNPVKYEDISIYPVNVGKDFDTKNVIRFIVSKERPDIIVPFGDPRFFYYLFEMDDEIRERSKIAFYHTWDNDPFPKFNVPFYKACDYLVFISKFSYNLISPNVDIPSYLIQHGYDKNEFYPLEEDIIQKEREHLKKLTNLEKLDFVIFWNNRNISRKRLGDVLVIFKKFQESHPNSVLLVNTNPIDMEGIDIIRFQKELGHENFPFVFNFNKVSSKDLNLFYNTADVTLNIAHSEGFGLCVGESLLAETPVIATKTGGMTEQLSNNNEEFGKLLPPAVRNLYGIPGASYIYQDYVSHEQVLDALEDAYKNRGFYKTLGKKGRTFIIENLNIEKTIQKWDDVLLEISQKPTTYKRIKTFVA
ncbi:MAG: glycosyltransferase family 4 protein [Bacilli bacterium]|nr:glycosyltransferase family 4 protein [Bacilli bacterium]